MEDMGWLMAIIIGALAGWIAEKIMRGDHGLLTNIVLGIVGASIGNWLMDGMLGGLVGQLITAVIGACLLITIWRMICGNRVR